MKNIFMDREKITAILDGHQGKIIGMLIGLFISIFIILIGIIKTLFIAMCIYIGYFLGKKIDNKENLLEFLDKILPPGNFK